MQPAFNITTLTNTAGMQVAICNYGARILSIKVPNKEGVLTETVLNHKEEGLLLKDDAYLGATCGRVANRISGASFILNGSRYDLTSNEGNNILHGGKNAFDKQYWKISSVQKLSDTDSITLELYSPTGDNGFPGNLTSYVTYSLTNENILSIAFKAECDEPCPINLCNHSYFHLGEPDIYKLTLQVKAAKYLPVNSEGIPSGKIDNVTPELDLNKPIELGKLLTNSELNHCFVVDISSSTILSSKESGIRLNIESDQVGMQVYSGRYLSHKHRAIALEAQGLVDAINQPTFASDIVSPNKPYSKTVKYIFDLM